MNCDVNALRELVSKGDDLVGDAAILDHIEQCVSCQRQLEQVGAPQDGWEEARRYLSSADMNADSSSPCQHGFPPLDLGFLEQAAHPELLGRIGRYDIESILGRGGMGVVFRAHDGDLHRTVAIKVLAPQWAASQQARQRFAREAQAAASVAHESVIPIYNVESDAPLPYLVMRYIPGGTLEEWVRERTQISPDVILRVAGQLAEGLSAAHRRGLIHRDIKPANVMVGENTDRVWITDFGLARAADNTMLTQTGVIAGTPHYMSPEQARGEPIDQRSDLFSLGSVFYFLATGLPPLDADNTLAVLHRIIHETPDAISAHRSDLPPAFVRLVGSMLSNAKARRPRSCEDVIRALHVAGDEMLQGKRSAPAVPPSLAKWTLPAALMIALVVGWSFMQGTRRVETIAPGSGSESAVPISNENETRNGVGPSEAVGLQFAGTVDEVTSNPVWSTDDLKSRSEQLQESLHRIQELPMSPLPIDPLTEDVGWQRRIQSIRKRIKTNRQQSFDFPMMENLQ